LVAYNFTRQKIPDVSRQAIIKIWVAEKIRQMGNRNEQWTGDNNTTVAVTPDTNMTQKLQANSSTIHQPKQPQRDCVGLGSVIGIDGPIAVGDVPDLCKALARSPYLEESILYPEITHIAVVDVIKTRDEIAFPDRADIGFDAKLVGKSVEYVWICEEDLVGFFR